MGYIKTSDYHSQLELLKQCGLGRTIHELAKDDASLELANNQFYYAGWSLWLVNHSSTKYIPHIKLASNHLISVLKKNFPYLK